MNTLHKKNRWKRSIGIFFDFSTRLHNLRNFFKGGGKVLFFMAIICLFIVQTPIASGNDEELYNMAYRALEMEPGCVKKARMTCMLDLLYNGADDRYLHPNYYLLNESASKFVPPESNQWKGPGYFHYARSELLESLKKCDDDNCAYDRLSRVHDNIHNSYARALQLEGSAALGGGSTYSKFAKAYHAWVSKMQRNSNSVYSAWTPECNGNCDDKDASDIVEWLKSLFD